MDGKTFYGVFLSFFSGVLAASYADFGAISIFLLLFALTIAFTVRFKYFSLLLACAIALAVGAYRQESWESAPHPLDIDIGQAIELSGHVSDEPVVKELSQRFSFKPLLYEDKISVSAPIYPKLKYGDALHVSGKLRLPENFETYPGGPVFDYVSHLSKDGIRYILEKTAVERLPGYEGNAVKALLFKIKNEFVGNIAENMPEPHSSLAVGILLGEKSSIPKDLEEDFRRTGLTHILVLSGSNVSIVAESFMRALSFLPRAAGHSLGAFSIILFAIMTGASATTVRASIMALVLILSKRAGRNYDVSRALLLAAFFMVLINPAILAFDIGFQLSFLSTLALVILSPLISERLEWVTEKFQLRYILSATVSTQIFLMPFLLYKMGEASLISLVTNLLVLPIVPWSMLLGFLSGLAGFLGNFVSMPFSLGADILLSWMIGVVNVFGGLSFASAKLAIGKSAMISAYAVYAVIIWKQRRNSLRLSSNSD